MVGDMSRGNEQKIMRYRDRSFSVLICFEDIFPFFVLKASRKRDFLINITNDSWFAGEPEATQHLGIMAMRAIENRISIVRSANTGISGWVSFKGTIEKLKKDNREIFLASVGHFNISLNRKRSFYNTYGEIFPLFCAFALVASLFIKGGIQ
jgi:apolipoprotein N-acyltransferase